jgi:hypothetical protein
MWRHSTHKAEGVDLGSSDSVTVAGQPNVGRKAFRKCRRSCFKFQGRVTKNRWPICSIKKALGSVQQRKLKGVTAFEEKKRKERNVVGD